MLLEQTVVSRKTPLDGKLEVSAATAAQLGAFGAALAVEARGDIASARVSAMMCTCARRDGGAHEHHFLESPILKSLHAGNAVRLELDSDLATVRVELLSD